ncbi:MAG TPA: glycosyltransferase family 2 protein [Anaerolineaceae bacterium]|nr:glycosyltransferase family 2 protein [Anaerolineaceae bacterium]
MGSLSDTPKVTIVSPSYNQAAYLEAAIRSVLAQDYPDIEYIIVDGGSQDGSAEIIQKYADRLAWMVSEKDKGHADALNKGFSHATGEIFAWLNSDDEYYPGAVSEAVAFLRDHPRAGMVYGDANFTDLAGKVIGQFASRQTDYRRMLQGSVHIPQATTFFRADLWRQVGPLDLSYFFAFDYDLWVKLAKISEICYVPRLWANFRMHDAGKSVKDDVICYQDMQRVFERETGRTFSGLRVRWYVRRLFYAWLPWRVKLWLRKAVTF